MFSVGLENLQLMAVCMSGVHAKMSKQGLIDTTGEVSPTEIEIDEGHIENCYQWLASLPDLGLVLDSLRKMAVEDEYEFAYIWAYYVCENFMHHLYPVVVRLRIASKAHAWVNFAKEKGYL